jgi:uncharacterized damage-inducible protein DinB
MPRAAEHPLSHHLLTMAYNNAWANHRLLGACMQLTREAFVQERVGFFPSIKATLNHNLTVDWFYVNALERAHRGEAPDPAGYAVFAVEQPMDTCSALHQAQSAVDQRLLQLCAEQRDGDLQLPVRIVRPSRTTSDTRVRLLAHLLQHQIHHRGQVHAMLAGTAVRPPQLDDFFCAGDQAVRADDFAALGWTEDAVWN